MPGPTLLIDGLTQPVAMRAHPDGTRVLVALRGGQLVSVDLATGQQTELAQLNGRIAGFALTPDGEHAYVGVSNMRLWEGVWDVPLDGSAPSVLARPVRSPRAITVDPSGQQVLIAEGRANGRLFQFDLAAGQLAVVEHKLARPSGMVYETASARPIISEHLSGDLVVPDPTGPAVPLVSGLGQPVDLAWHDAEQTHLLVADAAAGRVLSVDLREPANPPVELISGLSQLRGAQPVNATTLAVLTSSAISLMDLPPVEHAPVEVTIPSGELFVSGWVRAAVTINDPAVAFDDIDFRIDPPESGALVSYSRDNGFDPGAPSILVTAGWRTGAHELIALSRIDGSELGRTRFEVVDTWTHPTLGPSIATFGTVISGPDEGTWGGPDSGDFSVPQNIPVTPRTGTWHVAVVLVETAQPNGQYPTGAALTTLVNDLRDELVNGVTVNGQTRSLADYYAAASDGKLTLDIVGPVGPVALPNAWNSYFSLDSGRWRYNEDTDASIIAEIVARNEAAAAMGNPPFLDLGAIDSVIYVVRSAAVAPPGMDRFVWPRASRSSSKVHTIGHTVLPPFGLEIPVLRALHRVFIPDDWATRDGNRRFHETAAHELGHNLGLRDQYNKSYVTAIADRITAQDPPGGGTRWTWELMAYEQDLPMPSAAHRLMLGWLDPAHVKLFNFGTFGAADEEVTLHAVADGPPAPGSGEYAAIEVRLEDGKNYYFEYRPAVTGSIVDSDSPEARAVLGTEALTRLPAPTDRAQILLVQNDADAVPIDEEGSFIQAQDFKDKDTSSPGFENDFVVDVISTTATTAKVRVRYAADNKPDPGMTPWSPSSNWQSPDIEVVNFRSMHDKSFHNIPWEGHDNWVTAKVNNRGLTDAHQVTVDFFALDFTFGGGAEHGLGSQTLDVPIGPEVVFTSPDTWRPPQVWFPIGELQYQQHACFGGRFGPFQDPVTHIWEVTTENNLAQSNYTWMASSSHSPATREVTAIWADNPFDQPAVISFSINQPHPLFRVYLDHRWVYLQPGERQQIMVMVESLLGDTRYDELSQAALHEERMIETQLRLSAAGDTGETCADTTIGGVAVRVIAGYGTEFEYFEAHAEGGGWANGRVIRSDNHQGVSGTVLVSVMPYDLDDPTPEVVVKAELDYDGYFSLEFMQPELRGRAQASYLGWYAFAPCESAVVEL